MNLIKGNGMKKLFCVLILLLIPVFAYAEQCADIEYAELKDMSRESFDKEYCNVTLMIESNFDYVSKVDSKRAWKDMDSCTTLADKMSRVYQERFKTTPKKCSKAEQLKKAKEVWPDRIVE
jgi:hypothetical protein